MFSDKRSLEYEVGVETFLKFGLKNASDSSFIFCPCIKLIEHQKLLERNKEMSDRIMQLENLIKLMCEGNNKSSKSTSGLSCKIEDNKEQDIEDGEVLEVVEESKIAKV